MKNHALIRSVALLAMACVATAMTSHAFAQATLDEAEVKAWIKADSGPKWGKTVKLGSALLTLDAGKLTLDLSGQESGDFKMASLMLPMSAPAMEAGQTYRVSLEAKSSGGASCVLLMPEDSGEVDGKGNAKPKSQWFRVGGDWPEVSETFVYDPEVGDGMIKLFFTGKQAGKTFEFRNLNVEAVDDSSEPE